MTSASVEHYKLFKIQFSCERTKLINNKTSDNNNNNDSNNKKVSEIATVTENLKIIMLGAA